MKMVAPDWRLGPVLHALVISRRASQLRSPGFIAWPSRMTIFMNCFLRYQDCCARVALLMTGFTRQGLHPQSKSAVNQHTKFTGLLLGCRLPVSTIRLTDR